MASFCPVNLPLPAVAAPRHGSVGQVSPRWMAQIRGNTSSSNPQHPMARNELRTSTQPPSTHGTFVNQRPLPTLKPFLSPYTAVSTEAPRLKPKQQHPQSQSREEERAEMIGMKEKKESTEPGSEELVEGSGNKKKGKIQRFYCGNFPPCNLSFTRSEHLARHIRKHTGERPFQCHCSRRFSRLDNLRQHAQTVHQHEPIPLNSLAATGTRFQRQGRDKGKSQRNKTKGNQSGPVREHKRNSVSTSSIGSVTSTLSSLGYAETQRPKSQLITSSERGRGVADISVNCSSPNQFMTPASASTLNHHESPQWSPAIQSPALSYTHMPSVYEDPPSHYRRSSISSVSMGNPFKSPTRAHPVPSMHTKSLSLSNIPPKSPAKSDNRMRWLPYEVVRSPDGTSRRRTWHPEMGTSHMMQEPNFSIRDTRDVPPQQSMSQGNHQSLPPVRLPGIESFDSPPRLESPYSNSDERRPRPWPWDSVLLRIGAHGRPSR